MKFDIGIIGGGPAGYSAAFEAAEQEKTVVLFENREIGGTCLNRGCIPTKFLAHTAEMFEDVKSIDRYGIEINEIPNVHFEKTKAEEEKVVHELREQLLTSILAKKIEVINAEAIIDDATHISAEDQIFEVDYIILATGSVPSEKIDVNAINSDELLQQKSIPKTMKIYGGGVVAVEFAYIYALLGTQVTMYFRANRLLRKWDKDLAKVAESVLKSKGVVLNKRTSIDDYNQDNSEVAFMATGRSALLPKMKSDLVELDENGAVVTDCNGKTMTDNVYAIGDVISNSPMLAHVAMEQGRRAIQNIFAKKECELNTVANCIYLRPEIVSVGYDKDTAEEQGINCLVVKHVMYSNARTRISSGERSFIKLVANSATGRIIGAQLACERASDIASELCLAINQEMIVEKLADSTRPHPSFCEEVTAAAQKLKGIMDGV